ncbi:MAG: hypothetical protein U0353_26510 [Sandaracinus sp.]
MTTDPKNDASASLGTQHAEHASASLDAMPGVGAAYVAGQLAASLRAAAAHTDPALRERAEARAKGFVAVLQNLVSGALRVGQRQPYAELPTWVTPEVVRGGFATGKPAAGGDPRRHEIALAKALGCWPTRDRTPLHGHHLTPDGLEALGARLHSRAYRVDVPEEGALLAVRWLVEQGALAEAAQVLETIEPFFDRVRFYPRPAEPMPEPIVGLEAPVLARSASSLAEGLAKKTPSVDVETMREHHDVWAPLTDRVVALVLDTVVGEPPRFEGEGAARTIVGGHPFARLPHDFEARRVVLLAELAHARARHTRCRRVHRDTEVLGLLTSALTSLPTLDAAAQRSLAARVRHRLAGFVTAYGAPGSEAHRALRARQRVGPSHAHIAHVLAERLTSLAEPGQGLSASAAATAAQPITAAEQREGLPTGTAIPRHLAARLEGVEEASLETLRARGLVRSGETLATLLPQLTGPALATRFSDASARTLYTASYRAFRQRRSLLLLWLQHQVRFSELPWIAALEASADTDPRPAVEDTLRQLAAFAITSFPETITPNKLVSELAALAQVARGQPMGTLPTGTLPTGTLPTGTLPTGTLPTGTLPTGTLPTGTLPGGDLGGAPWLPLVEEVASDIFMGTFSVKYLRAAQVAARVLSALPGGALYARYYGLDHARVLAMSRLEETWRVTTCPDFDAYCLELAALPAGGNPRARSGAMIEQAAILTTHNLAVLLDGLRLAPLLEGRWEELASRALVSVLDRLERRVIPERVPRIQRMRASKTLAFGWRQAIFFLACLPPAAQAAFVAQAKESLGARTTLARQRFAPVLVGLERAVAGHTLPREASYREVDGARRLLGWSVASPFLMG